MNTRQVGIALLFSGGTAFGTSLHGSPLGMVIGTFLGLLGVGYLKKLSLPVAYGEEK